jgi:ribosomal protein S18 acetylase RimI-like enzyme
METVVTLTDDDAGELLTLQRAAYVTEAQVHDDPNLPPLTQSLLELADELTAPGVIAIGFRNESQRIVAAVRLHLSPANPHVAELVRLIVAPDLQGQGLGSQLLRHAESLLPATVAELALFTGEHSVGNLRLYDRFGYRETHRTSTPAGYALVHLTKKV